MNSEDRAEAMADEKHEKLMRSSEEYFTFFIIDNTDLEQALRTLKSLCDMYDKDFKEELDYIMDIVL